jgi:hypothetical protein
MMSASKWATTALIALVLCAAAPVAAELPPETRWADPSRVELDIEFPGEGYHANWELFRCDCGDLMVRSELNVPGEVVNGDLLLVKGSAVLTRGFGNYKAEAAASLDAAALMMQLALRLLERSEPGGPSQVTELREVDVLDEINHIHLDTGSAEGNFQAPWAVEGTLAPVSATQRKFDLRFKFRAGVPGEMQEAEMRLYGVAEYANTAFPVAGTSVITDWDLTWRDERPAGAVTAKTLDELRAQIENN